MTRHRPGAARSPFRPALVVVPFAALALAAGCGGGGGSCGNPRDVAGTFSGTLVDSNCGNGTLTITLAQNDCSLQGVWSSSFGVPACSALGSVDGSTDDTDLNVRLAATTQDSCSLKLTGVVGTGQIAGNYVPDGNCRINGGGTFSVTRTSP